jgi:hypothetical protein
VFAHARDGGGVGPGGGVDDAVERRERVGLRGGAFA